ncbi:pyridoxamine 5'-phosphate oxidase family protein [Microbacterium sp. SSW1-49]|uniref:Pyridoxamine 5'-phosphate oxidase family protein n=1 Tax=Microbacterium croceum TaxID=2851645 RepID=A0ABT0FCT5_9MICO|nr:pyridoxamine 5'-phosphate oxidase family protein [Microbacterium croceum]
MLGPAHEITREAERAGDPMRLVPSLQELLSLYKTPPQDDIAVRNGLTRPDAHCRAFIAHSPIVFIGSTADSTDVSPRGDRAGFVEVLDHPTLAIPDRPGNNRLDTLENIERDPSCTAGIRRSRAVRVPSPPAQVPSSADRRSRCLSRRRSSSRPIDQ